MRHPKIIQRMHKFYNPPIYHPNVPPFERPDPVSYLWIYAYAIIDVAIVVGLVGALYYEYSK